MLRPDWLRVAQPAKAGSTPVSGGISSSWCYVLLSTITITWKSGSCPSFMMQSRFSCRQGSWCTFTGLTVWRQYD